MNAQFNPIDYSQELQSVGVSQSQAEVHARALSGALRDNAASKADLAALNEKLAARLDVFEERITVRLDAFASRMNAFEERITLRLDAFESRMNAFEERITLRLDTFETRIEARVAACEASVKLELSRMREEMAEIRGDLKFNRWMSGITLAMVFAMFAKLYIP